MPISAIAIGSALQAGKQAITNVKLAQVASGTKTFTEPKTAIGKLIAKVTGRSEALIAQNMNKEAISNLAVQRAGVPVTGALQFGEQAKGRSYLPFALLAGVVLFFFSPIFKKRRRR
jgi:hypothetical protein